MRSARSPLRLRVVHLEARLFREILRVGLLSAIGTISANLTIVVTAGYVGRFGRDAIAGYGIASRLDYMLIPLLFALGTAAVTMVGTNIGAGQRARARRIAWTSALISVLAVAAIGAAAAAWPEAWMRLFSTEPAVVRTGVDYLHRVAPFYAFIGLGMALYFASQGAGSVTWPFSAGLVRLATVLVAGGYWVVAKDGTLAGLFWIVAASQVLFGSLTAIGVAWQRTPALTAPEASASSAPAG
jgi:MATE family, multidrug efflux pump